MPESVSKLVEEMICACNLSFGLYPGLSHGAYLALKSHGSPKSSRTCTCRNWSMAAGPAPCA
jgi:hypothetical protein